MEKLHKPHLNSLDLFRNVFGSDTLFFNLGQFGSHDTCKNSRNPPAPFSSVDVIFPSYAKMADDKNPIGVTRIINNQSTISRRNQDPVRRESRVVSSAFSCIISPREGK